MIKAYICVELNNGTIIKYVRDKLVDSSGGALQTIKINSGGTGYLTSDINTLFTIGGSLGKGAITAVVNGVVTKVALIEPYSGYSAATAAATSGGSGSGLTLDTTVVPSAGSLATLTVVSGGASYTSSSILSLNTSTNTGIGAHLTTTDTGALTTGNTVITSSGTGYTVGSVYSVTSISGPGSGATVKVATVVNGIGVPRRYYCYDGVTHVLNTELGASGQILADYNTITGIITTGTAKIITFPDSYTYAAGTYDTLNTNQPLQRGLFDFNYIPLAAVSRVFIVQEWFDATNTGILFCPTDTTYTGISGPTYQTFS